MSAINVQGVATGAFTKLATSVADCSNTTNETTVLTVTVPKNTWNSGEIINIWARIEAKQNSGGAVNFTQKVKVNSSSITVVNASSIANSTNSGKFTQGFSIVRNGSDVEFMPAKNDVTVGDAGGAFMPVTTELGGNAITTNHFSTNIYTSVDFTADVVITMTAQWASSNANTYFNGVSVIASKANR